MIGWTDAARAYLLGVEAIERLEQLAHEVGGDFSRHPSVYFTRNPLTWQALRDEGEARRRAGLVARAVERDELRKAFGLEAQGGLVCAPAAATDPYRLTHALLRRTGHRGARVFDRTCITAIHDVDEGVTLHTDRGRVIRAGRVVIASGYESHTFLPENIATLHSTYAIVTEPGLPLGNAADQPLFWEFADPYVYFRVTGDGRIMMGGEDEPFVDAAARDRLIDAKARILMEKLGEVRPDLRPELAFAWAGTFGRTRDGLGYIGPVPKHPRRWCALGFGGNGITFSVLAARMLLNLAHGNHDADLQLFRFGR